MILSHRHKFIFIKTAKTASSSVEIALAEHCGPEDIITPLWPEDEVLRTQLGIPGPQNYEGKKYYNHMPASQIKTNIGADIWHAYFKFCVERNPWDRAVSLYYFTHRTEFRPPISEFIKSPAVQALNRLGCDLYTLDGRVAVDHILRWENLTNELEQTRLLLGMPKLHLPHAKSRFRVDKRSYKDILSTTDMLRIGNLCSDTIKLLNYSF